MKRRFNFLKWRFVTLKWRFKKLKRHFKKMKQSLEKVCLCSILFVKDKGLFLRCNYQM
jgi:hypothetical protein